MKLAYLLVYIVFQKKNIHITYFSIQVVDENDCERVLLLK